VSLLSGSWLTLEGNYLSENEESKPVEFPPQGSLTPQLIQYYSAVVGVILGNSDQMLQAILFKHSLFSRILYYVQFHDFIQNRIEAKSQI